ncbi:MAG: GIY-YIG nuclease family protein [Kiloniellales bacterium]
MSAGYVYILMNASLRSNQYKIGKTTKLPEQRAREISAGTGVPQDFEVVYQEYVADCHRVEQLVHASLAKYRVSGRKEFFEVPLQVAIKILHAAALEVGVLPEPDNEERTNLTPVEDSREPVDVFRQDREIDVQDPGRTRTGKKTNRRPKRTGGSEETNLRVCSPETTSLYWDFRRRVLALDDRLHVVPRTVRIAFKLGTTKRYYDIAAVIPQKNELKVRIRGCVYSDPKGKVLDGPESWKPSNKIIYIRNKSELQYDISIIKQSYQDVVRSYS